MIQRVLFPRLPQIRKMSLPYPIVSRATAAGLALGLAGIALIHLPVFQGRVPGDLGDIRLTHLYLEHYYHCLFKGWPTSLLQTPWNFYPARGAMGLTDPVAGIGPFYVFFRALGLDEVGSLQALLLLCSALNYLCFFLFLRTLGFASLAAWTGSYLFAFSMARGAQLYGSHIHLLAQFATPLALAFLVRYFRAPSAAGRRREWFLFLACTAWQLWMALYLGCFLGLGLCSVFFLSLFRKECRKTLWERARADHALLLQGIVGMGILLLPLALILWQAKQLSGGYWPWQEISGLLPSYTEYFIPHLETLVYQGFRRFFEGNAILSARSERMLFVGIVPFVTLLACVILSRARSLSKHRSLLVYLSAGTIFLLVAVTLRTHGGFTLWKFFCRGFGPLNGLRAISRIILFLLVPFSVCLGLVLTLLLESGRPAARALALGIVACVVVENLYHQNYSFSRQEFFSRAERVQYALRSQAHPCAAFYLSSPEGSRGPWWIRQLDAMWASMRSEVPTLNGYAARPPRRWINYDATPQSDEQIGRWLRFQGLPLAVDRVCRIDAATLAAPVTLTGSP